MCDCVVVVLVLVVVGVGVAVVPGRDVDDCVHIGSGHDGGRAGRGGDGGEDAIEWRAKRGGGEGDGRAT